MLLDGLNNDHNLIVLDVQAELEDDFQKKPLIEQSELVYKIFIIEQNSDSIQFNMI